MNCPANRACSSGDSVRFKSAWTKQVLCKSNSTKDQNEQIYVEKLFIDPRVQRLLKMLTGMDIEKIYADRVVHAAERKHYALMTDDMITYMRNKMEKRGQRFLRFVPVKEPRSSKPTVISQEGRLMGFDNAKFVFTDITYDATNRDRVVVVRETNGILRTSTPEEHDRMNRTYYPTEEKPVLEPPVFSDPSFTDAMKGNRHELVLDWACHFFEPDDPRYVEICIKVFEIVAEDEKLDVLRSTRHFAMMVFYLVLNKKFAPLLNYLAKTRNLADVANAIRLIRVLNPDLSIPLDKGDSHEKIVQIFLGNNKTIHNKVPDLISFMRELLHGERKIVKSAS